MKIEEDSDWLFTALKLTSGYAVTVLKHGGITVKTTGGTIVTWGTDHVTRFVTNLIFTGHTVIIRLYFCKPIK